MIHPFEDKHVAALELNAEHQAIMDKVIGTLRQLSAAGHAGTIIASDGTVIGVYGAGSVDVAKLNEAEVFLFLNQRAAQRYAGTLVKDLRHELNRARAKYKAVNAVSADAPLFFRWFHHLGFKFAGQSVRGGLAWTSALLLTFLLETLSRHAHPGVSFAGVETAIIIAAVATAVSTGVGVAQYEAAKGEAAHQRDLESQQQHQLQQQQHDAEAQAAAQATTGASFGFSEEHLNALSTGFGFGGGGGGSAPNNPRTQITGMG